MSIDHVAAAKLTQPEATLLEWMKSQKWTHERSPVAGQGMRWALALPPEKKDAAGRVLAKLVTHGGLSGEMPFVSGGKIYVEEDFLRKAGINPESVRRQ